MVAAYEVKISSFREAAQEVAEVSTAANAANAEVAPNMMESIVDFFNPSAGVEANQQAQTQQQNLGIEKSTWTPQAALKTNEVATGVEQSSNAANAMGAEAEKGLNDIAAFEEDMKGQQAGAQAHDGSGGINIAGAGRGLAFDVGAVAAVGALGGPAAGAALGGAMLARDAFKAVLGGGGNDPRMSQGPSPKTVTLKGQEARDAERGHLPSELERVKSGPSNSFEAQARQAESGYGRSNNPVLEAMSKGPGFGGGPQDLLGRMNNTMDFDDMDGLKISGSSEANDMNEHIKEMKAGFENQLHSANDLKEGFAARANNGVEIQTAGELDGVNAEHAQMSASQKTAFVPGQFA